MCNTVYSSKYLISAMYCRPCERVVHWSSLVEWRLSVCMHTRSSVLATAASATHAWGCCIRWSTARAPITCCFSAYTSGATL